MRVLAAVVDSGAENVLPPGFCSHVKLSTTRRSGAGIGFRGADRERIRNHCLRKFEVRMRDGHVAGSTWPVADVNRMPMSVAKMGAAGNRVQGDVIPLRSWKRFRHLWLVRNDPTSKMPGFHRQP